MVASKTNEGADVAHHMVSPLVLRSLADRLASFQAPAVKQSPLPDQNRIGKYGFAPGSAVSPPPEEPEEELPPPPTVTEDLVIKLLACLMVHPHQGQRARLVLRDELPEQVYMALHQAGSVPADVKGDSATALPPLPHRDTDHKLYPKKGNAGAGAAGAEPARATGGALTPELLAAPLVITVVPHEKETAPVTVQNVEGAPYGEESVISASESSQSPQREGSIKRSVVSAMRSQRMSESRLPTILAASSISERGEDEASANGRAKGLWKRASVSWAQSSLNPANGGIEIRPASPRKALDAAKEERPLTVKEVAPSPLVTDPAKIRAASMRKLATRLSPRQASQTSPIRPGSIKGKSTMGWGTSSAAPTSPKQVTSPK